MPDTQGKNDPSLDIVDAEIVDAEVVDAGIVQAVLVDGDADQATEVPNGAATNALFQDESQLATDLNHLSAKGGAVGGLLLALLGLIGMFFSGYSLFNVLLAVPFSIWGLNSPLRRTAITGLMIALAGLVAFLVQLEK